MSCHVNVGGGVWKGVNPPGGLQVNVGGGVWKQVAEGWVNVGGGVWKLFYLNTVISLFNHSVNHSVPSGTAEAAYYLEGDGDIVDSIGFSTTDRGDWINPKGTESAYECRATLLSGTNPTGGSAMDTWLASNSTRFWQNTRSSNGTTFSQILVEIRRASDGIVLTSATIDLDATVEP